MIREQMWNDFSEEVRQHVTGYTAQQYGDYPNDQLTEWTLDDIKTTIKRYANRIGSNQRGPEDQALDFIKIAHYAQVGYLKFLDKEKEYDDMVLSPQ